MIRRLFILLNVAALAALWAVCLSVWVHPAVHPRVAVLGLAFPAVLVANLAFVPVWAVVRRRLLLLPLSGMALVAGYILDYCPMNTEKNAPDGALKVITYNCHGYGVWSHKDDGTSPFDSVVWYLAASQADIICLQEAPQGGMYTAALVDSLGQIGYDTVSGGGLVILSRLPIVRTEPLHYPSRKGNASLAAVLLHGSDTLRVVSNHFESDAISEDYQSSYASALRGSDAVDLKRLGHDFMMLLASAAEVRATQIDSVCAYIDRHAADGSLIVCGDFNDTPLSYSYHEMDQRLTSAYRESGTGLGLTYNKRKFPVRIDHIFVSRTLRTYHTYVEKSLTASDHYPVVTWVK